MSFFFKLIIITTKTEAIRYNRFVLLPFKPSTRRETSKIASLFLLSSSKYLSNCCEETAVQEKKVSFVSVLVTKTESLFRSAIKLHETITKKHHMIMIQPFYTNDRQVKQTFLYRASHAIISLYFTSWMILTKRYKIRKRRVS